MLPPGILLLIGVCYMLWPHSFAGLQPECDSIALLRLDDIPLHKAKEIIFSLSPKLITEDEFLAFAEIACHECEGYYILGGDELYTDVKHTKPLDREIIDVTLIDESIDLFMETKQSQQDKPYYVPDKKHLLEYDDPFYCEDTPEK